MQGVVEKIARSLKGYSVDIYHRVSEVKPRKEALLRSKADQYKKASFGSAGAMFGAESHPNYGIALIVSRVRKKEQPVAPGERRDITPIPISGKDRTRLAGALSGLDGLLRMNNLRLDYLIHDEQNFALVSITRGSWHGTRFGWFGHRNKFIKLLRDELEKHRREEGK